MLQPGVAFGIDPFQVEAIFSINALSDVLDRCLELLLAVIAADDEEMQRQLESCHKGQDDRRQDDESAFHELSSLGLAQLFQRGLQQGNTF